MLVKVFDLRDGDTVLHNDMTLEVRAVTRLPDGRYLVRMNKDGADETVVDDGEAVVELVSVSPTRPVVATGDSEIVTAGWVGVLDGWVRTNPQDGHAQFARLAKDAGRDGSQPVDLRVFWSESARQIFIHGPDDESIDLPCPTRARFLVICEAVGIPVTIKGVAQ